MRDYRIVLGMEISNKILRAAEIEQRENGFFLSRIAEQDISSLEVDELVHKISFVVNEEGILSRTVSMALDTAFTLRDIADVDPDLANAEIVEFLKAEIDFHNKLNGEQYVPAYEVLDTSSEGYKELFYAAIGTNILNVLKESCTRCGLDLQFIDLDHSCSELAVNRLNPSLKNFILITVKKEQVEGSLSRNGHRTAYKYLPYSDEPFYSVTKIAQTLESTTKDFIGNIYVTGQSADAFLLDLLQKNVDDRFQLLNPASNLTFSPLASMNPKLQSIPHIFSAVIGAALK